MNQTHALNEDPEYGCWADTWENEQEMPQADWHASSGSDEPPLHLFKRAKKPWQVRSSTTTSSTDSVGIPPNTAPFNSSASQGKPCVKLSLFNSATDPNPLKEITLTELVEMVCNPPQFLSVPFKECQEALSCGNEEAYRVAKKRLPAVTLSGCFQKRGNAHLKDHSGLMVVDLDHIKGEELRVAREQLESDPHCGLLYRSPSGEGLKGGLLLKDTPHDDTEHKRAFAGVKNYLQKKYGLDLDPACKDVSRLSFLSCDPSCFYNTNARPLDWEGWLDKEEPPPSKPDRNRTGNKDTAGSADRVSREKVEATLFRIPPRPDYHDWFRIAAAVRNSLGDDERAAEMLSRWSPEEEEGEYYRLLRSCDFSEITFGTLDHYAKEETGSDPPVDTSVDEDHPLFTDLSPYLDGSFRQEVPSVGLAYRDFHLFYAGRLNEIHSEPAVGKTNVAMAACISVLEEGGMVLYIDPEDTPLGFATRMISLGASPDDIRGRVFYLHNPSQEQICTAQKWAEEHHPDIVVLDGLAESMAAVGSDENKAADVLGFFRATLRPFAEAGAAVLIADHVTKNSDNRGQFARGSGAKAGRYDGVSYEVMSAVQYTPTQPGFVKLKIQKDRNGGAGPRGKIVAQLHFTPGADGRTITEFREPERTEGGFRPTAIMDKIVRHLEEHCTAGKTRLRGLGKSQTVDLAIEILMDDKVIDFRKVGQSHQYFLINPPACSPAPPVFHPCSEQGDQPCSPVPPPMGGTGRTGSSPSTTTNS